MRMMLLYYENGPTQVKRGKYVFRLGEYTEVPEDEAKTLLTKTAFVTLKEYTGEVNDTKKIISYELTEEQIRKLQHSC